jgi:two-component system nitrogen regulation response regulator GlnG
LFLDEIGDMPFELQTRLLRVLSDGHFYRVGGHSAVKSNVRVIAATHQNLEQRVKDGAFREDLFHRLNVIRLRLPALRERKEDVPMLTRHFLQQSAKQLGVEPKRISDTALAWLEGFAFPGNVRQLENICHWLTVMAPAQVIEPKDLPPEVHAQRLESVADLPASGPAPQASLSAAYPQEREDAPTHRAGDAVPVRLQVPHALAMRDAAAHGMGANGVASTGAEPPAPGSAWEQGLESEAVALLGTGSTDVWDVLTKRFESRLILAALANTKGRRIEAAHKLGIGRNTITRKIQELGLE